MVSDDDLGGLAVLLNSARQGTGECRNGADGAVLDWAARWAERSHQRLCLVHRGCATNRHDPEVVACRRLEHDLLARHPSLDIRRLRLDAHPEEVIGCLSERCSAIAVARPTAPGPRHRTDRSLPECPVIFVPSHSTASTTVSLVLDSVRTDWAAPAFAFAYASAAACSLRTIVVGPGEGGAAESLWQFSRCYQQVPLSAVNARSSLEIPELTRGSDAVVVGTRLDADGVPVCDHGQPVSELMATLGVPLVLVNGTAAG